MDQETISRILEIEKEAVRVRDDARSQAAHMIEESETRVSTSREQVLAQARQEAEQIVADGRKSAESERARVFAQAEAEAQRMAATMTQHLDRAVQFVLDQVAGRI